MVKAKQPGNVTMDSPQSIEQWVQTKKRTTGFLLPNDSGAGTLTKEAQSRLERIVFVYSQGLIRQVDEICSAGAAVEDLAKVKLAFWKGYMTLLEPALPYGVLENALEGRGSRIMAAQTKKKRTKYSDDDGSGQPWYDDAMSKGMGATMSSGFHSQKAGHLAGKEMGGILDGSPPSKQEPQSADETTGVKDEDGDDQLDDPGADTQEDDWKPEPRCTKCFTVLSAHAKFCHDCGMQVGAKPEKKGKGALKKVLTGTKIAMAAMKKPTAAAAAAQPAAQPATSAAPAEGAAGPAGSKESESSSDEEEAPRRPTGAKGPAGPKKGPGRQAKRKESHEEVANMQRLVTMSSSFPSSDVHMTRSVSPSESSVIGGFLSEPPPAQAYGDLYDDPSEMGAKSILHTGATHGSIVDHEDEGAVVVKSRLFPSTFELSLVAPESESVPRKSAAVEQLKSEEDIRSPAVRQEEEDKTKKVRADTFREEFVDDAESDSEKSEGFHSRRPSKQSSAARIKRKTSKGSQSSKSSRGSKGEAPVADEKQIAAEVARAEMEVVRLEQTIHAMQEKNMSLSRKEEALGDELQRTNLDRIESELRVAKLESERKLLAQKLEARDRAFATLQQLCDSRGADLAALREELESKVEENRELDEKMEKIVEERLHYKSDISQREREIEHLCKTINETQDGLDRTKQLLDESRESEMDYKKQLARAHLRAQDLNQQVEDMKEYVETAEVSVEEKDRALQEALEEKRVLAAENTVLKDELVQRRLQGYADIAKIKGLEDMLKLLREKTNDLTSSESIMRTDLAAKTMELQELRGRVELQRETIVVLEDDVGALRATQGRLQKVAHEKEREAATALMSLESAQRDYEQQLTDYAKLEGVNGQMKAKLVHIETEFECKKRDYHAKLNMLEEALQEEKKQSAELQEDLRKDANLIAKLRDEKRQDIWERDRAKSERREAENQADLLKAINEARVQACQDSVDANQQRQLRELNFTMRQSQALLEGEREDHAKIVTLLHKQLEDADARLREKDAAFEKQAAEFGEEMQRQREIAAMTAADGETVAWKLAEFVQDAEESEAAAIALSEELAARIRELEDDEERRVDAEAARILFLSRPEAQEPLPKQLFQKYDWKYDEEEQRRKGGERKSVSSFVSDELKKRNVIESTRGSVKAYSNLTGPAGRVEFGLGRSAPPAAHSARSSIAHSTRSSIAHSTRSSVAPRTTTIDTSGNTELEYDSRESSPSHGPQSRRSTVSKPRSAEKRESTRRKSHGVKHLESPPLSARTDESPEGAGGSRVGSRLSTLSAAGSPSSAAGGQKKSLIGVPAQSGRRPSRVAGLMRPTLTPASPKGLEAPVLEPAAEEEKPEKEPEADSQRPESVAESVLSPGRTEDGADAKVDQSEPASPAVSVPQSMASTAVRKVEMRTAEIQAATAEATVSVQTDLSFMLAALMSKKPGSQRAIEEFARQTFEEFGVGQAWGSLLSKQDMQVTKPVLLATQPTVPDAPPTILKTKDDPRRANFFAQSTGFAQKSGPYFLKGKGSQRANPAKPRALYDVVPQ